MLNKKQCLGSVLGFFCYIFAQSSLAAPAVSCDNSSDFGGTVYQDFNENGIRDVLEPGVVNITVTAYDASNNPIATSTSGSNGVYILSGLANGTRYRLEFTGLPSYLRPAAQGTDSATTVQFVTASNTCDVNVGVHNPSQYCQADPEIVTAKYVSGDHSTGLYSSSETLFSINAGWGQYATGNDATPPDNDLNFWRPAGMQPRTLATANDIGAVYGMAWSPSSQYLYASAYHKAHADYGPGGRGQIYRILMDAQTGQPQAAAESWVNVETDLGLTVCGSHGVDLSAQYDQAIFDQVGKCSLGDLDISSDESTLYVTNLTTKEVVGVDTTSGAMTGQWAFPTNQASCSNAPNDVRPFGLKVRNDLVYVGAICSAETSRNKADLRAYVYTLDPATGTWTSVLEYDWSKQRYSIYGTQLDAWLSNVDQIYFTRFAAGNPRSWVTDNSQMLTDIEFVGDDMVLGFRGRLADQWGVDIPYERTSPPAAAGQTVANRMYTANTVGDVVCVAYDPVAETYIWETNEHTNNLGVCGNRTASASGYTHPNTDYDTAPGADPLYQHPDLDDGEFYWGDGGAPSLGGANHHEISLGGLAQYGVEPLIMTSLTPPNALGVGYDQTGGFVWHDNRNGAPVGAYVAYDNSEPDNFSKAAGLGDVEALCNPAPVEVGNYVWLDSNGNGLPDPDENGINGVAVTLTCGVDSATTVTANNGQYFFSNMAGGNATFMDAGENCTIQIDSTQLVLSNYELTTQDADGITTNSATTDLRDSDASMNATQAEISFAVGASGENNHTFDIGYRNAPVPTSCYTSVNNASVISVDQSDTNSSNDYDSASITVNCASPSADLALVKTVDKTQVLAGDTLTYTLTLRNTGGTDATDVEITDQLPTGVTYVSHSASQGSYIAGTGIWAVGTVAMGTTVVLTINVSVN